MFCMMKVSSYAVLALVLTFTASYDVAYVVFMLITLLGAFLASRINDTPKDERGQARGRGGGPSAWRSSGTVTKEQSEDRGTAEAFCLCGPFSE